MSDAVLRPVTAGGVTFEVTVDRLGVFYADAPGFARLRGDSYRELADTCKVRASQRRVKVEVPFTTVRGTRVYHRVATGIHGGNGSVLYREDDGKGAAVTGQLGMRADEFSLKPLSPADERRYVAVTAGIARLRAEQREIVGQYEFRHGITAAVQEAVEQAATQLRVEEEHKEKEEGK
jgi:hypothetical protein